MEEEERAVETLRSGEAADSQSVETSAQLESDIIVEEDAYAEKLASVIPDTEANQKPFIQMDNLVILDHNGHPVPFEQLLIVTGGDTQVLGSPSHPGVKVLLPQGQLLDVASTSDVLVQNQQLVITDVKADAGASLTAPNLSSPEIQKNGSADIFEPPPKPLSSGVPNWALRLRRCERIGDSYRGYCNTEAELEAILLLHKQQTHAVFGTRQSPSLAKPATRLMWKSQYVPYDGIPFVNAGSRAIVMECQFGPRRKGIQPKKGSEQESNQNPLYKTTCPARIYIKKVRKFLEYKVSTDPKVDKKIVRQEQEKAFFNLKKSSWDDGGVVRYYIQLPTENAHTYHDVDTADLPDLLEICIKEEEEEDSEDLANEAVQDGFAEDGASLPSRLHPLVAEKICDLVAQGHDQVYAVRKQLRRFVEREMFKTEGVPERHNLCYFPTVNDIKNHIHEAQKALQLKSESDTEWKAEDNQLIPETLSPATVDASSQKEELLEESETLSPEAVHLFSSLNSIQPKIFAHLQSINLQHVGLCPEEDSKQALSSAPEARELSPVSVLLGPSVLLQSNVSAGEGASESNTDSELVSVSPHTDPAAEGGITQILQGEPVPVQIVELSGIAPTPSENAAQNGALGDHPPGSVQ